MDATIILSTALAYLLGSIPNGVLAARLFGWPDPRTHGSGHTGGLNSLRGGGLPAGILVTTLDVGKGALAYLLGSIPNGVLAARLLGWPDPRTHGSGHTGGLNSLRGGGLPAGILVTTLDVGKGALAIWLTHRLAPEPPALGMALAGAAVVAGHNWPVTTGFKGGMGLATGGGAMLTHAIIPLVIAAAAWGLLLRVIRHKARAVMAAALTVPLSLWLLHADAETFWLGAAVTAVVLVRHLADWNRVYD